ncbi:MAG: response regulator [Lachnospiraceae bacterium]|jgi:response regulator RpfG family c-di-GMP phosphodiesterase|nr:response regulator [Lachnospiraceae bacterium]
MTDWIVVVDDDATNLKMAGHILSKHNKRVTAMKSGRALLEYLQENKPDLVLLDVKMPEMDGFETLQALRDQEKQLKKKEIPVIFLTADDDENTKARGFEMGVLDYIHKPFNPEDLVQRIDRILEQQRSQSSEQEAKADLAEAKRSEAVTGSSVEAGEEYQHLNDISRILSEKNIPDCALQLERDDFINVYRYVMRYVSRYHKKTCKLLFTLSPIGTQTKMEFEENCDMFCECIREMLRKSDLIMQYQKDQVFIFLTDIKEDAIAQVIGNMITTWNQKHPETLSITYEVDSVKTEMEITEHSNGQPWVVVVDDDVTNLKLAGHVLGKSGMRVTALKSGSALLDLLRDNRPNLILLDVRMPGMDGFETKERLMAMEEEIADIPVIFLTANDDIESEKKGLALGAIDFIRKPFVPEVLVMRVSRILDMVRLQRNLADEVEKKTRENKSLFLHVVQSLADAIDAKDSYTNGHSGRVAEYSKEIAKRAGYDSKGQSNIYMMGLLHDVGKIGVPDEVINKPARLTPEEYEIIKKHPVIGSQILENIEEMPELATGARWHHERYDGTGYPDGLVGQNIPEAARIIAVADAYDAMTSYRSYRDVIPQQIVRQEIERCSGTQFDPKFAEIMIKLIDEDKDYHMKEKRHDRA